MGDLEAFKDGLKAMTQDEVKEALIRAGIYDKEMRLTDAYKIPEDKPLVTEEMRTAHFDQHGMYVDDDVIYNWWVSKEAAE